MITAILIFLALAWAFWDTYRRKKKNENVKITSEKGNIRVDISGSDSCC
jgi:uncharacterized membrane protein